MLDLSACKSLYPYHPITFDLLPADILPVTSSHFSTQIIFCFYFLLPLHPHPVFSPELHPSFRAPRSLHPLHRIDCNSGVDLVLVGGAGVLRGPGMAMALLLPAAKSDC